MARTEEREGKVSEMQFADFVEINPMVKLNKGTSYPFVAMEIVTPGSRYVKTKTTREYTGGGGSKFCVGDTLFARITPCLENGKIAQFRWDQGQEGFGSTEFFVFRARDNVSIPPFVYYLASTEIIRCPAVKSMTGASGRRRAELKAIENIEIPLVALPVQHKIASILSAYDDLIENNNRRIKILEEMAQMIYREWFVNFRFPGHEKMKMVKSELGMIPEGWEVKNLFDIAEVTYGFPFKSKLFKVEKDGNNPVIRIRDILNSSTNTFTPEIAQEKYIILNGDILVGMDGDFHMGKWSGREAYLNQRVVKFKPLHNLSPYFLFWALKEPIQHFNSTIVGTTVAHLGDSHLRTINILIPDDKTIKLTREVLNPIYNLEIGLKLKNSNLRKTRDLLLPKLISGEIDVEGLDIKISEEVN